MKVSESFVVPERRDAVWGVVGQVERIARCLPGVEEVTLLDGENATVRITQSLGPLKATFDAKLRVTSREPGRSIGFGATGRSVRGAAGNVRATNIVRLEDEGADATRVVLEADVALGGMLGAVGQKVVARQAAQLAKAFAEALERELRSGNAPGRALSPPERATLPGDRTFGAEFLELRERALRWIGPYYDGEHLTRAADWLLALEPAAPEPLVLAALMHDMERSVPGGPVLDKARQSWDDVAYNRAHCDRSAEVVADWLVRHNAPDAFVEAVRQPIREHEFGGSPEGDLMQAADSISFLEVNAPLVARWVEQGECSLEKGRAKLQWMCDRVRLERARETARKQLALALAEVDRRLDVARP